MTIPNLPFPRARLAAILGISLLMLSSPLVASDHADPTNLDRLEGGITDLFAFPVYTDNGTVRRAKPDKRPGQVEEPKPDSLVLVMCVRRLLSTPPPYEGLSRFVYKIHLDLKSGFDADYTFPSPDQFGKMPPPDKAKHALQIASRRYGGVVRNPESLKASLTFKFQLKDDQAGEFGPGNILNDDIVVVDADAVGASGTPHNLPSKQKLKFGAGVRDDPFIFPQFFGTNVFAMGAVIPYECLPAGQRQFILWGTSERDGIQIDHVGRSQRTQLPRFDLLNTVHPKDHVAALKVQQENPGLVQDFLRVKIPTEFNFRPFDMVPDVMFLTRDAEVGYPNGRRLEDDVAHLSCLAGDCQLFELSQGHAKSGDFVGGRPTTNDKPFSDTFPFLADPWPDSPTRMPPELTTRTRVTVWLIGLAVLLAVLLPWVLYFRALRRLRQAIAATKTVSATGDGLAPK